MLDVEIDVGPGSLTVAVPARDWTCVIRDVIRIRDGKLIVGVGDADADAAEADSASTASAAAEGAASHVVTRPALAANSFDPEIAAAVIKYAIYRAARDSGSTWRDGLFGRRLSIKYPEWHQIAKPARRRFLERVRADGFARVEINGAVVIKLSFEIPIIGPLFMRGRILPDDD